MFTFNTEKNKRIMNFYPQLLQKPNEIVECIELNNDIMGNFNANIPHYNVLFFMNCFDMIL